MTIFSPLYADDLQLQQVNLLDSLFTSNEDTLGSILDVERQELFEIHLAKQNQINVLTQTLQTASQIQRDSITSMNNRIVSNKHYELYDQELNTIEIKRLNAELMYYLPEQEQVIENIASLCPVAGGPAVYKARAMLTLFNDTLVFYDDSLCSEQGYAYRMAQQHSDSTETLEECIVYPNPSKSVFMVYTGSKGIDEIKELILFNSLGQIVLRKRDSGNQFLLDFMNNELAQGIYTLQISFPFNGRIEYKKLVYAK